MKLTIKGNIINTSIQEHRKILGDYGELLLNSLLIKNNIRFDDMNLKNKFSRFDYLIKDKNDKPYIIELKTRIGNLNNHSIEILDYNKIQHYLYLKENIRDYNDVKIIFIFNHIETEENYKFYYYEINDYKEFLNISFLNSKFENKIFELPIKYLKPIENLLINL
jgi:hypothetical protein